MNYRSVNDLSRLVTRHAGKVPGDVELVVGIPRSGMLVASMIAIKLNRPLTDLYSFLRNDDLQPTGTLAHNSKQLTKPLEARKILLVDDSIASGGSMAAAAEQVAGSLASRCSVSKTMRCTYLASHSARSTHGHCAALQHFEASAPSVSRPLDRGARASAEDNWNI